MRQARFILAFGVVLGGCATRTSEPPPPPTGGVHPNRPVPSPSAGAPAPVQIPESPLPPPLSTQTTPENPVTVPAVAPKVADRVRRKSFAVWIDGTGLESFIALGFLQELEKAGFRPKKVVGTGLGCWIASSWGIENNGNRAEWQAFKLANFDSLGKGGLLGRLSLKGSRGRFAEEMGRLLPVKNLGQLKIPTDCPLYGKKYPHKMFSGRGTDLASLMWLQLQIPAMDLDPDAADSEFYSGGIGGGPTSFEIDEMSRDLARASDDEELGGWIVLRTRSSGDRAGPSKWLQLLSVRDDTRAPSAGLTASGLAYVVLDVSDGPNRSLDDLRNFEQRRRWLLEGRKKADSVLKTEELKRFLGLP